MNNIHGRIDAEVNGTCTEPAIRAQLAIYLIDPLGDPSAEKVEDHLLECRQCRNLFLVMLSIRKELGGKNKRKACDTSPAEGQVLNLLGFRSDGL